MYRQLSLQCTDKAAGFACTNSWTSVYVFWGLPQILWGTLISWKLTFFLHLCTKHLKKDHIWLFVSAISWKNQTFCNGLNSKINMLYRPLTAWRAFALILFLPFKFLFHLFCCRIKVVILLSWRCLCTNVCRYMRAYGRFYINVHGSLPKPIVASTWKLVKLELRNYYERSLYRGMTSASCFRLINRL